MNTHEKSLADLITLCEAEAIKNHDGHLAIMRFTTHWKATLGTPNLLLSGWNTTTNEPEGGYLEVKKLRGYSTLREALESLLNSPLDE